MTLSKKGSHRYPLSHLGRLPAILVGKLVKESTKEPEKLEAYRTRLKQAEDKKQAIEEAATELLASNKPIVRIKQV